MKSRIRIKMCGVTRLQDALVAVDAGVDAIGFIFYENSPRFIDPEAARAIIDNLPPFVDSVGVFVDKKRNEVEEIIQYCRLGYAQLHGEETPKYCERISRIAAPCQVLKAFRVGSHLTAEDLEPYQDHVKGYLFDTFKQNTVGGTGDTFDWNIIPRLRAKKPFLLAGGLDGENVTQALQAVAPYGVDVNSGVETAPGIKDPDLIRKFILTVRNFTR